MTAFWQSLFFVFLSEMGDKSQVVSFAFGSNYSVKVVLLGIFIGVSVLMAISVAIGSLAVGLIPVAFINILSGVLFILFGLWTLRKHEPSESKTVGSSLGPLVAVTTTFFLAELGDKTILASMTLASQHHNFLSVWAGSTLGMFSADLIAVICGRILGNRMPEKVMKYGSAIVFLGAGIFSLLEAFHWLR